MRVALVTPRILGVDANPGWWMITNGIRNLVQMVEPAAQFLVVDMIEDHPTHWAAAATCDVAIMCGNPRFTLSHDSWWEGNIWYRLLQLQAGGVRVIDGWSGAAFSVEGDLPLEEQASLIRAHPRNATFLRYAAAISGRITRDPLAQEIYAQEGIASVQLPCSSWWAGYPPTLMHGKAGAVSILNLPRRHDVAQRIKGLGLDVLASTWNDYLWAMAVGLKPILTNDPDTLLRVYQRYETLLAFRIHAAIPAARMGCAVHVVAVDSRASACVAFGLPITPIDAFAEGAVFEYGRAVRPDEEFVLQTLKEMLCR